MRAAILLTVLLPFLALGVSPPLPGFHEFVETPVVVGAKIAKNFIKKFFAVPNLLRVKGPLSNDSEVAYYHSGFDNELRPVWVLNLANFGIPDSVFLKGPAAVQAFTKKRVADIDMDLKESFTLAAHKAVELGRSPPVQRICVIIDGKDVGYDFVQKLPYLGRLAFLYGQSYNQFIDYGYFVNMGTIPSMLLKPIIPFAPGMFSKFVIFTDKQNHRSALLRLIPKDQLPPSLGGEEGHVNLFSSLNQPLSNSTVLEPIKKKPNFLLDLLNKLLLQQLHLIPEKHSTQ